MYWMNLYNVEHIQINIFPITWNILICYISTDILVQFCNLSVKDTRLLSPPAGSAPVYFFNLLPTNDVKIFSAILFTVSFHF